MGHRNKINYNMSFIFILLFTQGLYIFKSNWVLLILLNMVPFDFVNLQNFILSVIHIYCEYYLLCCTLKVRSPNNISVLGKP